MNAPVTDTTVAALAQTLFHFLWQATVIWAVVEALVRLAAPRRTQTRYALYCAMLLLLAACPLVTFVVIAGSAEDSPSTGYWQLASIEERTADLAVYSPAAPMNAERVVSWLPTKGDIQIWVDRHRLTIGLVWLVGVVAFGTRLVVGSIWIWSIARRGEHLPLSWSNRVDHLARQLRFRTTPAVRVVGRISQAMAVGVIRPIVLLPAAWVSELDGEVLEAVIAHELAHVRRWDLPINFAQRLVESLLFFHPVVWWCSRRIRIEREMCCDELALEALGNPARYAKALTYLAQREPAACEPLLGAGMGSTRMVLLERIRNVLGAKALRQNSLYAFGYLLIGAIVASLVWVATLSYRATSDLPVSEPRKWADITSRVDESVPTEHAKAVLPSYRIEPPDILVIEALRVVPKPPHHIESGDELQIIAEPPEANLSDRGFFVDSQGRIDLGPQYGKVLLRGLTTDEATVAVREAVGAIHRDPVISLTLIQSRPMQPIAGEHLVSLDGTVNLGTYGQVYVAGKTIEEAKRTIDEHLRKDLDDPQVAVSVLAYNSKVYYVITQGAGQGDAVTRLPITGNETVLDAIAQVNGLSPLSNKKIWIARPKPNGAPHDEILPVNWQSIGQGAATAMNYQLLPGDRVFVVEQAAGTTRTE